MVNMPDGTRYEDEALADRRDRFVIHELVSRCCHRLKLPASAVWEMSLPDIVLSVTPPDDEAADDATAAKVKAVELDERRTLLASLTVEQRVALERLKADLM